MKHFKRKSEPPKPSSAYARVPNNEEIYEMIYDKIHMIYEILETLHEWSLKQAARDLSQSWQGRSQCFHS